jgi:uncharacterized protein
MFLVIAVAGTAGPAEAAPAYPAVDGRCVDQTGVLGHDLCAKVTAALLREERATSDEIAVVVVPTTGDMSIEAWSTGIFNAWGVGKKDKDNGALLVVAVDDHNVRLETGRGLAGRIGDSDAETITGGIAEHFARDEYALGILTGLDEVRRQLGHTVPAAARLESLAAAAPEVTATEDSTIWTAETGPDGSDFTAPDGLASSDDSSPPVGLIVIGAFVGVALIGFLVSRGSSRSASGGAGLSSSVQRSTWVAGNTDVTAANTPTMFDSSGGSGGSDSSGGSGSSFGGGSSDGGGGTSSW